MPDPLTRAVKPGIHLMRNRKLEIILGFIAVIVGCLMLYDAFDSSGKQLPWPLRVLAPW